MIRHYLAQLYVALGILTRLPTGEAEEPVRGGNGPLGLVLAGGTIGLGAALAGWLCRWLAGPIAGALLGGLLIPAGLWWLTRARGLRALLAVAQAGREASGRMDEFFFRFAGLQALLLVKLLCVGLLIGSGAAPWLFIAWLVTGAVFADERNASVDPRQGQAADRSVHWGAAAVGGVLGGGLMGQFVGALLVVVVAWLAVPGARRWLAGHVELRGSAFAWLFAEATEAVILLLATLVVFARY